MIIVTGGAGFIGSAVLWGLNRRGRDDLLVVDRLGHGAKWSNLVNRRFIDVVPVADFPALFERKAFGPVEAVIHMGACSATTETDADYLLENNFHYSRDLVRSALDQSVRLIHASSAATYGSGEDGFEDDPEHLYKIKPLNMYGYSKHLIDLWAYRGGFQDRFVSLKFFNVFGPNEYHKGSMCSMVYKAFHQIRKDGRLALFKSDHPDYADGEQQRDFVYVKDCVAAICWLLDHPEVCGLFNLGSGRARTWNALARSIFAALGQEPRIDYVDMPAELKGRYQYFTQASMEKLGRTGCPLPQTSLEAAVEDYIRNYLLRQDHYL